jgi:glucose/mannose transport system substrate-binding protein
MAAIWQAADQARKMAAKSNVQDWNQATNMVITDQAGGQIMGDWAQGEFQVAGEVAGTDYSCLPGLGANEVLGTAGDAFYFPLIEDEEISAAQAELAQVMMSPEAQVAFNLKKGSLPVRGDVDLAAANDCMKKGLEIIKAGNTVTSTDQLISPDTNTQLEDLMSQFFSDMSLTPEDAQARWAEIIADAD